MPQDFGIAHEFNTIVLRGRLSPQNNRTASVAVLPGHLIEFDSNGKAKPHSVRGGAAVPREFAIEDGMRGGIIDGTDGLGDTYYAIGDPVRSIVPDSGDRYLTILHLGENVTRGDNLISYGDGTLCKAASAYLANNLAASTTITNTTTETAFSNGTVAIPANSLKAGAVIRVKAFGTVPSSNGSDTLQVKLKIGTQVVLATTALNITNADIFYLDATLIVRTIGATGTIDGYGLASIGPVGATASPFAGGVATFTVDSTAALSLTVTATFSVAHTDNQAILQSLLVEVINPGVVAGGNSGGVVVAKADASLDLSVASANDFLPAIVV